MKLIFIQRIICVKLDQDTATFIPLQHFNVEWESVYIRNILTTEHGNNYLNIF